MHSVTKLLLAAVASLAFSFSAMADDSADTPDTPDTPPTATLRMGVEAGHPPFNGRDPGGQVVGFDVDIGNALCAKMKVECTVVTSDWDLIIPALNNNAFDFLISSMSITPDRLEAVDFTTPYYTNKLQFLAPVTTDLPTDLPSLAGKNLGAQRDTFAGSWLQDNLGASANILLYDTQQELYDELAAGNLDAILADKYSTFEWLKTDAGKHYEFKDKPIDAADKIGIAVRKGDPLRERLNQALQEIIRDGTYQKINDRYFPFSIQ
jgi:polar amino acid transport system substrate-binding protein